MNTLSFSESLKTAIRVAQSFAKENKNEEFSLPHLLRGLLHKEVGLTNFLTSLDKDVGYMTEWAEIRIDDLPKSGKVPESVPADSKAANVFEEADNIRLKLGVDDVTPICVLAAMVKPNIGFTAEELKSFPLREKEILDLYVSDSSLNDAIGVSASGNGSGNGVAKAAKSNTALLKYCVDKTSLAREGNIDPIIGRDKETRMMLEILGRRTKPNVIITGDPGVGKTALVDGFAISIAEDKVPDTLKGAFLYELDLGTLFAGASYKGEVEERLKSIIKEVKQFDKAILFIDEIHALLDPNGSAGGAANLLKPELARGAITVIGATTLDEYRKIIEPEQAFSRRFELVRVDEPDIATATKMLEKLAPAFEEHHNLKIDKAVLAECSRLAKRYVKDRRLPDAAVDLLDRTMASMNMMNQTSEGELSAINEEFEQVKKEDLDDIAKQHEYKWVYNSLKNRVSPVLFGRITDPQDIDKMDTLGEIEQYIDSTINSLKGFAQEITDTVTNQELAAVVAYKTGIPMGKIQAKEQQKLNEMESIIKRRVVGQDHAVKALADAIVESRSGLNKPGQPIGSFFLLGPTGTGKTEVTKSIAEFLFNDEKAMIRFDMSEFKEEHSAALLYGAPPGYVGYEEGGMLVNKIRQQPYSVVLFDEIEKAHPSVFDIFLQILDEGKMHDRLGKEGDFSNSLIIFTSNIGSEWIVEQFGKDIMPKSSELLEIMTQYFRPEFLARLTEIVPFAPISETNVVKILDIQMKSLLESLDKQGISLDITDEAKTKVALTGFTPKYGARQISGVIRTFLRRPISKMIVSGKISKGDSVQVVINDNKELDYIIK